MVLELQLTNYKVGNCNTYQKIIVTDPVIENHT